MMKTRILLSALCALGFWACSSKGSSDSSTQSSPKLQTENAAKTQDSLKVGTLNIAIGFDVASLVGAIFSDSATVYQKLDTIDQDFVQSEPLVRMGKIADSLIKADLDVIALQETLNLRGSRIGDVDFIQVLMDSIKAKGGPEYIVHKIPMNDLHLVMPPVDKQHQLIPGKDTIDLKFSEGNAILVKKGIEVAQVDSIRFKYIFGPLHFKSLDLDFSSQRGAIGVKLRKPGQREFQVWSTHLEVEFGDVAKNQAQELLDFLDSKRDSNYTQVVLGDLNFEPKVGGAAMLTADDAFADAWDYSTNGAASLTCCQVIPDNVMADKSTRRIDYVLFRDGLKATQVERSWIGPFTGPSANWFYGTDHALVRATLISQR